MPPKALLCDIHRCIAPCWPETMSNLCDVANISWGKSQLKYFGSLRDKEGALVGDGGTSEFLSGREIVIL